MGKWMTTFLEDVAGDLSFSTRAKSAFSANSPTGETSEDANGTIGPNGTISQKNSGEAPTNLTAQGEEHRNVHVPDDQDHRDVYEERAAVLEFDAHLPRAEAERLAWAEVYGAAETVR